MWFSGFPSGAALHLTYRVLVDRVRNATGAMALVA